MEYQFLTVTSMTPVYCVICTCLIQYLSLRGLIRKTHWKLMKTTDLLQGGGNVVTKFSQTLLRGRYIN